MSMNNDVLKKCIVRLEYKSTKDTDKFEGSGSGAIVHLDNKEKDYFYIFTAKHTFFKDNTNNVDMDEGKINLNNISIFDFKNQERDTKILSIIGIDKKYDFLILVVAKATYSLPKIPSLPIYEDDFKECKICGFPSSKKPDKNTSILFDCTYSIKDDVYDIYEVKSIAMLTTEAPNLNANDEISGLSGSGVFVESATGKLYLAGIQIQTASHNSLVCLDIRILAREINEALKHKEYSPIEIDGYALKEELGIDTSEIDFTEMLDKLKDDELDEFKDKSHKKIIEAFNGGIKQKLDEKSKELAKKYLYLSLLFHKEKDNRRSTIYFKKAVKNNPSYYALFLKVKDERKLTDKEKEKYNEINSEVSNSDISADDLFFEMLEDKLMKLEDFDEKEGVYMQILGLLESKFLDLKRESEDTTEVKNEIISKFIELFNQYIEEKKFDDANSLLNKLKKYDYDIINEEYELYTDENFSINISLSKLDLSKKYLELLEKHKNNSEKFSKLKSQLEKVYSDETDVVHNELKTVKKKMENYEEKVEKLVQIFTTYMDDKEVLNKVGEVDSQLKKSHIKLDNISDSIKNNHNSLIQELQSDVIKTNRELVARVQKIYNKHISLNREVEKTLETTVNDMSNELTAIPMKDNQNYTKYVRRTVKKYNIYLYKGIKKLYENNTDSKKDDFFKQSLILAEKRHQEHLVSLKRSLEEKNQEIKVLKNQLKKLKEGIDAIKKECDFTKIESIEVKKELLGLQKEYEDLEQSIEGDSKINLTEKAKIRFQNKIDKLQSKISDLNTQLIFKDKDMNLQKSEFERKLSSIKLTKSEENLKESLELSKDASWNLLTLETKYQEKIKIYINELQTKYNKLDEQKQREITQFSMILKNINIQLKNLKDNPLTQRGFNNIIQELDGLNQKMEMKNKEDHEEIKTLSKSSSTLLNDVKEIDSNYKMNMKDYFHKIEMDFIQTKDEVSKKEIDKILVKYLKRIEKEILQLKKEKNFDNNTLFRLDSQLQQIRDYIPKEKSFIEKLDALFSIPRVMLLGGIILLGLIVLFLNEPILLGYP